MHHALAQLRHSALRTGSDLKAVFLEQKATRENAILHEKNHILIERLRHYKDRCHQLEAREKWMPTDRNDEVEPDIPMLSLAVSCVDLDAMQQSNLDKDKQMERKDCRIHALKKELVTLRRECSQTSAAHTQAMDNIDAMKRKMLELKAKCAQLERQCSDHSMMFNHFLSRPTTRRMMLSRKQSPHDIALNVCTCHSRVTENSRVNRLDGLL